MTENESDSHPEEGTIHALLDGALGPEETARLEAHLTHCDLCRARVAEARGLIAGASRVVSQLDDAPAPLIRPASTATVSATGSVWRRLRVTPARAAIAAVLLVAVGITLTRQRAAVESSRLPADSSTVAQAPGVAAGATRVIAPESPARDSVLRSAIARRLASQQPPRTVESAPGLAIVVPPPAAATASADVESRDAIKVATGRASIQAQLDSASPTPDRSRAGVGNAAVGLNAPAERVAVAAKVAESVARSPQASLLARATGGVAGAIAPGECYRIDGAPGAAWGAVPLPLIVAVDSSGRDARILASNGSDTEARASLRYSDADSVVLSLRRIGYAGTMTLEPAGTVRTGTLRSAKQTSNLESVSPITANRVSCPTTRFVPPS